MGFNRLEELQVIAQPEIEREIGSDFVFVLGVKSDVRVGLVNLRDSERLRVTRAGVGAAQETIVDGLLRREDGSCEKT